ncbi:hypothetical protein MtrunA17_Chr4g0007751 [Medicago truncatula]|uniref:Uncharacterized protein n=1 Tax=Medicago truncatula TaxID=3880 RepID=A0A396I005_MEDTR|nr:hypothetical protein MtrunA17_Chr4g0007751 [Medicago truncatula]
MSLLSPLVGNQSCFYFRHSSANHVFTFALKQCHLYLPIISFPSDTYPFVSQSVSASSLPSYLHHIQSYYHIHQHYISGVSNGPKLAFFIYLSLSDPLV